VSIVTSPPRRGGGSRALPATGSEARAAGPGRDRRRGGQIVPRGGLIGDMLLTPSSHWHGGRVRVYRLGVDVCP